MSIHRIVAVVGISGGLLFTPLAQAESGFAFGPGNAATARLDFQVLIPRFLLFRVGTAGSTVDLVTFDIAASGIELGNGTAIPATTGGDVDVQLLTNTPGDIAISASTTGPLTNGGTGSISFDEISTVVLNGNINPPTLTDGGSAPVAFTGGVGNHTGQWRFSYDNTAVPEEGTYGGAGVGTVTYTATLP